MLFKNDHKEKHAGAARKWQVWKRQRAAVFLCAAPNLTGS